MSEIATPGNLQFLYGQAVSRHQGGNPSEAERLYLQILAADAFHSGACHMLGILWAQQGRMPAALELMGKALERNPKAVQILLDRGNVLRALGRNREALASYEAALAIKPDYVGALSNRGDVLRELGRLQDSLASLDAALQVDAANVEALNNRGITLCALGRFADAVVAFDRALAMRPGHISALNNRGFALRNLERPKEAIADYDKVLGLHPQHAEAWNNRALALRSLGRFQDALADNTKALAIRPAYAEAFDNRGLILLDLHRPSEALFCHDKALAGAPDYAEAWYNRGNCLTRLARFGEALESFDRYLALRVNSAEGWNNHGIVLVSLDRLDEALTSYERALAVRPDFGRALYNRGVALWRMKQFKDAAASYRSAWEANPPYRPAMGALAHAGLHMCDWALAGELAPQIEDDVQSGEGDILPFVYLGYSGDEALQQRCAENYSRAHLPQNIPALWTGQAYSHQKIRVAYMSTDFRRMPMSCCVPELFERHDRTQFEIMAVSLGQDDHSAERERFVHAVDLFADVHAMPPDAIARFIHDKEIDILVDLNGHTEGARMEILCHRPAPVQIGYMGYPGTAGTSFVDYIIADDTVVPPDSAPFYRERILRLPDTYWVNDSKRTIGALPTKADAGLPEHAFVFCCFNNSWKISAPFFDIWMRLLAEVPESVLWLLETNPVARDNLCREAAACGIDPARLVFAKFMEPDDHLGRHGLADLFLDTLPYNAHTTACDALYTGVPVVTVTGKSFTGRVAASLLKAMGLPELVTQNLHDYETLALALARDPARLANIRRKLGQNRADRPLFDTDRFRRNLERIYLSLVGRSQ